MAQYSNGLYDTIDLTPSAITVLEGRYLKKDEHGKPTETAHDMFMRVAENIAQADKNYHSGSLDETTEKFYRTMSSLHFLPNSPTLMNAGRELQQLSACFVLPVPDSIDGIFEAAKQGALVHKCIDEKEVFITNDGIKQAKNLKPGDSVWTRFGWHKIKEVYDSGNQECFELETEWGQKEVIGYNHPLLIWKSRKGYKKSQFLKIKDTKSNWRVGVCLQRPIIPFSLDVFKFDTYINKRRNCYNPIIVPTSITRDLMYLLGLWFGDGCKDKLRVRFTNANEDILLNFIYLTKDIFGLKCKRYKNKNSFELVYDSKMFSSYIDYIGFNKEKNVIPKWLLDAPEELKWGFIEGLLDTDGCIKSSNHIVVLTNKNNTVVKQVQYLMDGMGIYTYIQKEKEASHLFLYSDCMDVYRNNMCMVNTIKKEKLKKLIISKHSKKHVEGNTIFLKYVLRPVGKRKTIDLLINEEHHEFLVDSIVNKNSGGGTGYSFSRLRPKGDIVGSTRGVASGPISFMSAFNVYTDVVKQGGTRRGANMGILRVDHPDIMEFIDYKSHPDEKAKMIAGQFGDSKYVHDAVARALVENYQLNNFNISVAITDKFMEAVEKGTKYDLVHPVTGKVVKTIDARKVFDRIANNAWRTAEPGIVYIDRMNRDNPTPGLGVIESTNPCGEQPLLPYESCNLGSIDVSKFVKDGKIDYQGLEAVVKNSIHFLDNVVDMNKSPIPQIDKMTRANRKVGLGIMGFADALIYMGIPYGSNDSINVAESLTKFIQDTSKTASRELARERGSFPNIELSIYKGQDMRNATTTTIAPTGTIGIITGCSQGIEPLYSVVVKRKTGEFTLFEPSKVFEKKLKEAGIEPTKEMLEQILKNGGPRGIIPADISDIFVTAGDLSVEQHIKVQAAFQRHIDNAVSKTINMSNSATVEDIEKAYALAYKSGLKGVTIYRDGSRGTQVLNVGPDKVRKSLQTIITEESLKTERPEIVKGETLTTRTPFGKLFVTINRRPDGSPYEIFCAIGKSGGDITAMAEGYGRLMSAQLQGGSTLENVAEQLGGIGGKNVVFDNGHTVTSLPDAISKVIKKHIEHYEKGNGHHTETKKITEISGNICPKCHAPLIATEGCEKCSDGGCDYSKCS